MVTLAQAMLAADHDSTWLTPAGCLSPIHPNVQQTTGSAPPPAARRLCAVSVPHFGSAKFDCASSDGSHDVQAGATGSSLTQSRIPGGAAKQSFDPGDSRGLDAYLAALDGEWWAKCTAVCAQEGTPGTVLIYFL